MATSIFFLYTDQQVNHCGIDFLQAVYRDLSILTAAYITEGFQKEKHSRDVVPAVLARPFYAAAKRVDQQLIMEYSS
jgi:hypothetical protein